MKKRMTGLQWPSLGPSEEAAVSGAQVVIDSQLPNAAEKPPSYPSSSKHKKDWSQVERAVEEDKPEGEQALNALFQQIFKDGSDEVRKAMMKSYVESGGTCLSTNWDEVKNDKVPVRPPEGMEAKQW
jgi:suppressor of G2 allele of SKP1